MGIKGIYQELGRGERIALAKLASTSFENHARPFRIAVDIAIWQFQSQAARGGTNPAIRTLFYRLVRLLGTPIEPIFVFDGPNKPTFKRNKRSGRGDGVATAQAKRLIRLFGFATHDAPGEAEAECALLQQHGIVDAVLSEDVDTIMFGCTRTLRNWSAEGKGTTPTHVSLYDIENMNNAELGLDREGMVLVALMSGGDYLPDGIPGCGVKVACEAAKAGFGKSLCRLKTSNTEGLRLWKESLIHELKTNESGYFRTKHKALPIPKDFPNIEVLRYYTHPVVSPVSKLEAIRENFHSRREMHLDALREFARETFDWDFRGGAVKFIRVLAQARLVDTLIHERNPENYVEKIAGQRCHMMTDGSTELRLSYIPHDLVPIDLSKEIEEEISYGRDGLALNSDEEFEADPLPSKAPAKVFDPAKPDSTWILHELATRRIPELVESWRLETEAKEARKAAKKQPKTTGPKGKATSGMAPGAMDQYVRLGKAQASSVVTKPAGWSTSSRTASSRRLRTPSPPPPPPSFLDSSKQPKTSTRADPVALQTGSSHNTPRTPKFPSRSEAILISSSPAGPPDADASPPASPPPRRLANRSVDELPESVRTIVAASDSLKTREPRTFRRAKTTGDMSTRGPSTKLKQTSMDMFATKSQRPVASQPVQQTKVSNPAKTRKAHPPPPVPSEDLLYDSDSSAGFAPLSTLMSRPPTSPSKRHHHPTVCPNASSRENQSPSPQPARKKKLFVPRVSDVGSYREIEVDADERDARLEKETATLRKRGVKSSVIRMSDVSIIDLTQDE